MTDPTRADLEQAARAFFHELTKAVDHPRSFQGEDFDQAVAYNIAHSEYRVHELDRQLIGNDFDAATTRLAKDMLEAINLSLPGLSDHSGLIARQLAARAARQQMQYFIHQLTSPATAFVSDDPLFAQAKSREIFHQFPVHTLPSPATSALAAGDRNPPLRIAVEDFLRMKRVSGVGQSQIDETARSLGWLQEIIAPDTPLREITKQQLRGFRTNLTMIAVRFRGRNLPFQDRLTNVLEDQIKSVTSSRYWRAIQSFFAWAEDEGLCEESPAASLKIQKRKGEVKESPEPFSVEEVKKLFSTPLYAGYESPRSPKKVGACRSRDGRWWGGILPLFTGMRAGELSQLLPSDFVFDAPIPHLKVQLEDEEGVRSKTAKNASSIRDLPLAPVLLELGLRQFVEGRAKKYPKDRVFREFRLGSRGRKSDGMTKFWGQYLKDFGLWKPGRATHVARHTVTARLRLAGFVDEDIGALVGHKGQTITADYGGAHPLERTSKTAAAISYGFDVVEVLGGPFDPKLHA